MFYIGAFVAVAHPSGDTQQTAGGYVAIVMIYVFVLGYCASWNGTQLFSRNTWANE
jgi:hypothetical protein